MSKNKTKEQLTEMAKAYFEAYPKQDVFLATSDGQFFTDANKSSAKSHAKSIDSELHVISRSGEKESGKNLLDVLSNVSGLSKEELKKTAQEVIDKKKAEANKRPLTPADTSPEGEDQKKQSDAGEAKVGEADGIVKEPIEAKPDGSENELNAKDSEAEKDASNDVKTEIEQPVWTWTMEKMADWLNAKNVNFDLTDDKKTLWGRVKAELEKESPKQ